ncbi:MAG: hypothetical protein Q7R39_10285 [Dehalococcoidia bacterium]|nr:hypothetical protein [Dehalococcoidia bacterium]
MPGLILLGADQRVAPFDIREKLAITRPEMFEILGRLSTSSHVLEVFVLSTFNQVEVYVRGQSSALDDIHRFWQERAEVDSDGLKPFLYEKLDEDAAHHLFSLGAGFDSAGSPQAHILPQIQESLDAARQAGSIGDYLEALLTRSLRVGRRARRQLGPDPDPETLESVRAMLRQEASRFIRWARERRARSAINALKGRAEEIRRAELLRIESKLSHLSPEERAALEALTTSLVNKLINPSKKALKGAAEGGDVSDYLRAASELFDLGDQ